MPKIYIEDKPVFIRLIEDLFPKYNPPVKLDVNLAQAVKTTSKDNMGFQTDEAFVTKVVQLKEILDVRHCVFVLGPTGSSKSAVWKTLV